MWYITDGLRLDIDFDVVISFPGMWET